MKLCVRNEILEFLQTEMPTGAGAEATKEWVLFAVTEKIDNMAKKEIDNQRDTDYNEFISGV